MGFYYKKSSNGVISASVCGGRVGVGSRDALRTRRGTDISLGTAPAARPPGRTTKHPTDGTGENPLPPLEICSYKIHPRGAHRLDLNALPCGKTMGM